MKRAPNRQWSKEEKEANRKANRERRFQIYLSEMKKPECKAWKESDPKEFGRYIDLLAGAAKGKFHSKFQFKTKEYY